MRKDIDLRFTLPAGPHATHAVLDMLEGKVATTPKSSLSIDERAREAAQGNAQAQYELAKALTSGAPLAEKNREAVKWLRKAVEKEHAQSEHLLGILIARGQGARPNPNMAHALFRSAATTGYAPAQYDLARSLLWGFGCEANPREALTWFRLAAAQGHVLSQKESADAYLQGRGCQVDLRQATSYLKKAVLGGLEENAADLGELYLREDNPVRNESEAIRWISEAARCGNAAAQYRLALFYESGRIRELRPNTGLSWAARSADNGFIPAYLLASKVLEKNTHATADAMEKAYALTLRALQLIDKATDDSLKNECALRSKEIELTLAASQIERAKALSKREQSVTELLALGR